MVVLKVLAIASHADLALCRLHYITLLLLKIDLTLFFPSLLSGTDVGCGARMTDGCGGGGECCDGERVSDCMV